MKLLVTSSLLLFVVVCVSSTTFNSHHIKLLLNEDFSCEVWEEGPALQRKLFDCEQPVVESTDFHATVEDEFEDARRIVDVFSCSKEDTMTLAKLFCKEGIQEADTSLDVTRNGVQDEVTALISSGPSSNRIDVVFMGDGYLVTERTRHLDDMTRLVNEMFVEQTFRSYLPLFNIWVVFRPSNERGIGVNSRPLDTAYRLYRDGNTLRGITTGDAAAARNACAATGPSGCDFPTLIANDEFYGGRGGAFTVSTRSIQSGTVVLRHEMGHNFASVGEEYDGGTAYYGANNDAVGNVNNLKWRHWLTDPENPRVEHSDILLQAYPWTDLANGDVTFNFTAQGASGGYARWLLKFSVSGCETPDSFEFLLDGERLPWTTTFNVDRSYTEIARDTPLSPGQHTLTFRQLTAPTTGTIRMICNLGVHEFGPEPDFHMDDYFYIGAYNTWNSNGGRSLRPQNEHCLMRNMTSDIFCPACLESIWQLFLSRMSLIDNVERLDSDPNVASVKLNVVPVAQFREGGVINNERFEVEWLRNGVAQPDLSDLFEWSLPIDQAAGNWRAVVDFFTDEVRSDPNNLLHFEEAFTI